MPQTWNRLNVCLDFFSVNQLFLLAIWNEPILTVSGGLEVTISCHWGGLTKKVKKQVRVGYLLKTWLIEILKLHETINCSFRKQQWPPLNSITDKGTSLLLLSDILRPTIVSIAYKAHKNHRLMLSFGYSYHF